MRNILLSFSCLLFFAVSAQNDSLSTAVVNDNDSAYLAFLEEFQHIFSYDKFVSDSTAAKTDIAGDAVNIKNRLFVLDQNTPFQLAYNDRVLAFIKVYLERKKDQTEWMLGLSRQYFPMMEEALDRHNMPLELKYLSVVESALNPTARSRAGAVGLWQFMYSTGRLYGMTITSYEDERKNPLKATEAACQYLGDLYKMFGNWEMALAAYNSGPGNVRKAIRRSGGKKTYWEIYPHLPRETRGYVPAFIAVNYAFNYYHMHHLTPKDTGTYYHLTDTLHFDRNTSLEAVAKWSQASKEELVNLNPSLKTDIIPAKDFAFVIPADNALLLEDSKDSLYNAEIAKTIISKPVQAQYLTYRVRRGDYLGRIAKRHGTTVATIKRMNGLRSNNLRVGQRLKISNRYAAKTTQSKSKLVAKASPKPAKKTIDKGSYKYYTIQPGDTLWGIASKLDGVSVNKLRQLNDVNNVKRLKPGQKIIVGMAS
jgi:membrane-bound lytic murein transglycosylase D